MPGTGAHASTRQGALRANVAVFLFGLAGVIGTLSGLPAPLVTLGRSVFAGVTLLLFAAALRVPLRPQRRRDVVLLAGQGVLLAIHWTAFFEAIDVANVALGLLAFSSFPLFTALIETWFLREPPRRAHVAAALLILPGVTVLLPTINPHNHATAGVLWGLLAGLTFALLSVVNRALGRRYSTVQISVYQDGIAALVLLPVAIAAHPAALLAPRTLLSLLVLGVACTALAHTLFIAAMQAITAQLASIFAALEPVWGTGAALVLLGQIPSGRTLVGGAIIVLATLLPGMAALVRHRGVPASHVL